MNTEYTGALSPSTWYYESIVGYVDPKFDKFIMGIDPIDTPSSKEKLVSRLSPDTLQFKSLLKFSI